MTDTDRLSNMVSIDQLIRDAEIKYGVMLQQTEPNSQARAKRAVEIHGKLSKIHRLLLDHRQQYGTIPDDARSAFLTLANGLKVHGFGLLDPAPLTDKVMG